MNEKEINILKRYLPENAVIPCLEIIEDTGTRLKIVNKRLSKYGDFRVMPSGELQVTVNAGLNMYQFLITLIHEIAHLVVYRQYGNRVKPHGWEWKAAFQHLMQPFISPRFFPQEAIPAIKNYFLNPSASTDTDLHLSRALSRYNPGSDIHKITLENIESGTLFKSSNGRLFIKGHRIIKRIQCKEVKTNREYLFMPNAEVEPVKQIHKV